jgi:hypothetical protein
MFILKNFSTQALIAGISYFVLVIVMMFNQTKTKMFLPLGIVIVAFVSILIGYDINCLTVGNCTTWSWFRAISILLVTLVVIFSSKKLY